MDPDFADAVLGAPIPRECDGWVSGPMLKGIHGAAMQGWPDWNHRPEKVFDQQVVYKGDPMFKLFRNLFILRQAWKLIKRRR
jgi:hypothetical protein